MSQISSAQPGSSNSFQRASKACDFCRLKRLKCTGAIQNDSCMNCVLYRTKCTYSASRRRQKSPKDSSTDGIGTSPANTVKRPKAARRPRGPNKKRPTSTFKDSTGSNATPSTAPIDMRPFYNILNHGSNLNPRRSDHGVLESEDFQPERSTGQNYDPLYDELWKELWRYLSPMRTEVGEMQEDILLSGNINLPNQDVVETLVSAYFDNIAPLYPAVDEITFQQKFSQLYQQNPNPDIQWLNLLKLMMCTGAAACDGALEPGSGIKQLHETMFLEVLSSIWFNFGDSTLQSIQTVFLTSLYCAQTKQPGRAWLWCRFAARLHRRFNHQKQLNGPSDVIDRLIWSLFIFESRLSLVQARDDSLMKESQIDQPTEDARRAYPILCLRLDLARLSSRFSRLGVVTDSEPLQFINMLEALFAELATFKENIPFGYQPEDDISVGPHEYHAVLLLHIEYYALKLAMFTALGTSTQIAVFPEREAHPSIRVREHDTLRVSSARRLLQTLDKIEESTQPGPNVSCWVNVVQVLGAFCFLYSHLMTRPSFSSADSDLKLLLSACQHVHRRVTDSHYYRTVSALIVTMYNAAAQVVLGKSPTLSLTPGVDDQLPIPGVAMETPFYGVAFTAADFGFQTNIATAVRTPEFGAAGMDTVGTEEFPPFGILPSSSGMI